MPITDGWCSFAKRYPADKPTTKHSDRQGHAIAAVVEHIAAGGYIGSRNWLADATANPNSSAHFIIDRDTGELTQLVPITRAAWANGLSWKSGQWYDPNVHLVHPSWSGLIPGVNPNLITVSVEHSGQPGDLWTEAETATDVRLLQWIQEQIGIIYVPHKTLIGHYEISPIDKVNCPGPHCDLVKLATLANGLTVDPVEVRWKLWGTEHRLDPAQRGFSIPQKWFQAGNAEKLGAAVSEALYPGSGLVLQVFQHGFIHGPAAGGPLERYLIVLL